MPFIKGLDPFTRRMVEVIDTLDFLGLWSVCRDSIDAGTAPISAEQWDLVKGYVLQAPEASATTPREVCRALFPLASSEGANWLLGCLAGAGAPDRWIEEVGQRLVVTLGPENIWPWLCGYLAHEAVFDGRRPASTAQLIRLLGDLAGGPELFERETMRLREECAYVRCEADRFLARLQDGRHGEPYGAANASSGYRPDPSDRYNEWLLGCYWEREDRPFPLETGAGHIGFPPGAANQLAARGLRQLQHVYLADYGGQTGLVAHLCEALEEAGLPTIEEVQAILRK